LSSMIILWSSPRAGGCVNPATALAISPSHIWRRLSVPCPDTVLSVGVAHFGAVRLPVEAPLGTTAARPRMSPSRITSASTVGLPRESMTCRVDFRNLRGISVVLEVKSRINDCRNLPAFPTVWAFNPHVWPSVLDFSVGYFWQRGLSRSRGVTCWPQNHKTLQSWR
jgi:hypothetical protein